ncbi:hypothetical protein B0H13DRAFT_2310216 [Mycena leptocephala]|nr:hypothetical protein B0H13DRAFT_2310216 [Mycena leptocephala]
MVWRYSLKLWLNFRLIFALARLLRDLETNLGLTGHSLTQVMGNKGFIASACIYNRNGGALRAAPRSITWLLNFLLLTVMESFNFPENLPPLPPNGQPWGANVVTGRQVLEDAYIRALQALHQEDSDALRYKLLSSNIIDNLLPVLEGLEREVPTDWPLHHFHGETS